MNACATGWLAASAALSRTLPAEASIAVSGWVVKRTEAWLARMRRLNVRYEHRSDIHYASTSLAYSLSCLKVLLKGIF